MIYSITEGQRAEEYKARKAKEKEEASKKYDEYNKRRSMNSPRGIGMIQYGRVEDINRAKAVEDKVREELRRRLSKGTDRDNNPRWAYDWNNAMNLGNQNYRAQDALNRHMRRHPDQYKESFLLTEKDADRFLESIGIALYNDFVTIGEYSIPGVEAEAILEEYGIFLYEEGIIIEGEQAKGYMNINRLETQPRKISKELPAADIKLIPKKDKNKNRMDTFVKNIHMRRHPDQYKESCGIFYSVAFI